MALFKKEYPALLNPPTHVAFIMDGNGRWAQRRFTPRSYGHLKGSEQIRKVAMACVDFKVKVMTIYAFSTENWKRPQAEVDYLFELFAKFFNEWMDELIEKQVKIIFSGFTEELPEKLQGIIKKVVHATQNFEVLTINICLNYGFEAELVKAVKEISSAVLRQEITYQAIDGKMINDHLFTKDLPPVDLMIRTGGEKRLSNFLLLQLKYAEIYFCDTLWPDFDKKQLYLALRDYQKRDRRFGSIKS